MEEEIRKMGENVGKEWKRKWQKRNKNSEKRDGV